MVKLFILFLSEVFLSISSTPFRRYAQKYIFRISLIESKFILKLSFSDWFDTKVNSVWCKNNRKNCNYNQNLVCLTRFEIEMSVIYQFMLYRLYKCICYIIICYIIYIKLLYKLFYINGLNLRGFYSLFWTGRCRCDIWRLTCKEMYINLHKENIFVKIVSHIIYQINYSVTGIFLLRKFHLGKFHRESSSYGKFLLRCFGAGSLRSR